MGDILDQTERAHDERYKQQRAIKKNKEKQEQIINGHICHRDVAGSISTMLLNPNKKWMERKKAHYLTYKTNMILTK